MFMGTTYNSIDDKNRMIVPSKLRNELGAKCVLTKGLDKCLYIYAFISIPLRTGLNKWRK